VSRPAWLLLLLALAAQMGWHAARPGAKARYLALGPPPPIEALRLLAFGEDALLARLLALWLQAHDTQPGISVPLASLDYERVKQWLSRSLELDPRTRYPLLSATRIYAVVRDPARQRDMLEFVHQQFLRAPERRWRWMAEAAILAKHRLHDLPLALRYARAITEHATTAPAWARDMSVVVLEDMGELEAARLLVGGLLHDGRVRDPHEIRFLERKLAEIEAREAGPSAPRAPVR
jgi:hypothetical protein